MNNMTTNVEKKELAVEEKVYYDQSDMQGEMMRYRTNSSSYKYGMLAIAFSVLAAFISLNSIKWTTFDVIIKILGNIVILLFGFLSIEKVKSYSLSYSYTLIGIGGLCVARMFWIPVRLITLYAQYQADPTNPEALKYLGASVIGDPKVNSYLPQSGTIRGVAAMVLIALAAACFIGAGVQGAIKAKHYAEYMSTQDTTKGV